jgi:hypothetical protein
MKNNFRFAQPLDKPLKPEQIPGQTIEEKIKWLEANVTKELKDLTVPQLYRILGGDVSKESEETKKRLMPYAKTIPALRDMMAKLQQSEGSNVSPEEAVNKIIARLLKRKKLIVVQKLIPLYSKKSRAIPDISELLSLKTKQEIAAAKHFVAEEIAEKRSEVKVRFNADTERLLDTFPGLEFDDILACILVAPNTAKMDSVIKAYSSIGVNDSRGSLVERVSPPDLMKLAEEIKAMKQTTASLGQAKIRPWNAILAKNPNQEGVEQYAHLIDQPIVWNLKTMLEQAGVDFSGAVDRKTFFTPEKKPDGTPFTDKEAFDYRIAQLKKVVTDGYDNEHVLSIVERDFERDEEGNLIKVEPVLSDAASKLIRYYFVNISQRRPNSFTADLDAAGLNYVSEIINSTFLAKLDERYAEFNFKILSNDEGSMLELLRQEFNLDAIPMPISMKTPVGCPTNKSFIVDFTIPCDILEGLDNQGLPVIKKKIVLVGEYFGWSGGEDSVVGFDPDIEWTMPDGSPATHSTSDSEQTPIVPGSLVSGAQMYKLRSEWKVFTQNIIGHMLNTTALHFNPQDLKDGMSVAEKLNTKSIIYHYDKNENACKALNMIKVYTANCPDENNCPGIEYLDSNSFFKNRFNSKAAMQINVVESYITYIKVSEGLKTTIAQYGGSDTFSRRTCFEHMQYLEELETEKRELLYNPNPASYQKIQELNEEIISMRNSPLANFKNALEQTLASEKFANRIGALETIKDGIESGRMNVPMLELKNMINEIMKGVIRPELMRRSFNIKRYKKLGIK